MSLRGQRLEHGADLAAAAGKTKARSARILHSDHASSRQGFIRQPSGPILGVPAQAGYGDKWPS
jgi:hypothetical protein